MTSAIVVQRELVVAGRRPATYWSRCLAAAIMATVVGILLAFHPETNTARASRLIFGILTWTTFAGTLLSGVFLTADALSSERREGTLGLLFLTELRGYDVVIGKLIASSIIGAYALMGILPVLAIPLLMGGVTGVEFGATAAALGATLLCSLGVGIYASARSRDMPQAMGLTTLILALLCALPLLAGWVASQPRVVPAWAPWIEALSPYSAVATGSTFSQATASLGKLHLISTLTTAVVGLAGVGLAALWLTRHWRTQMDLARTDERSIRTQGKSSPRPGSARTASACSRWYALQMHPSRPLVLLSRLAQCVFWGFLGLTCLATPINVAPYFITAMFTALGLHWLFKIQAALYASGPLATEAAQGGLELLLSTPLTPAQIVLGHRDAVEHSLRRPRRNLVLVNLGLLVAILLIPNLRISSREAPAFLAIFLGGISLLWVDVFAISRVGAWFALTTRNPGRAVFRTVLVSLSPTVVGALVVFLAAASSSGSGEPGIIFILLELCLILLAAVCGQNAATNTTRFFRRLASGNSLLPALFGIPKTVAPQPKQVGQT